MNEKYMYNLKVNEKHPKGDWKLTRWWMKGNTQVNES